MTIELQNFPREDAEGRPPRKSNIADLNDLNPETGGTGNVGIPGTSGYSGLSGHSGISGYSGISAFSGTSGFSGIQGPFGISGTSGFSGTSSVPTIDDKDKSMDHETSGDNDDTLLAISNTPSNDSYVGVSVNGIWKRVGNGVRTKHCYFASTHPFTRIGTGINFTIGLRARVGWAWGNGTFGVLGNNTDTSSRSSPTSIVGSHSFISVFHGCNSNHALALKPDGSAWAWGRGDSGQLGNGDDTNRSSPVSVVGGSSFVDIVAGSNHSLAIDSDGFVSSWGLNTNGQLGDGTTTDRSDPSTTINLLTPFSKLAAGTNASVGINAADGVAYCWGIGTNGQLGTAADTNDRSTPTAVAGGHSFTQITVGNNFMLALKTDGSCWAWGQGTAGQLGNNDSTVSQSSPVSVVGAHSFVMIAAGPGGNSLALKADGSCWAWGSNSAGRLGNNSTTSTSSPVSVIGDHAFIAIAAGNQSIGLKADGSIWCWGLGTSGQLGDNSTSSKSSPVLVVGFSPNIARSIANITSGDILIWNGNVAGSDLLPADYIDLHYAM